MTHSFEKALSLLNESKLRIIQIFFDGGLNLRLLNFSDSARI